MLLVPRFGHDYLTRSRMDAIGKTYIAVCVTWTTLLLMSLAVFLHHRKLHFIRMRNPFLVVASILMIHVYLCIMLLLYPLNASYSCDTGFWIMSIYFPLGIACWHLANAQLLSRSGKQKSMMASGPPSFAKPHEGASKLTRWSRSVYRTNVCPHTSIAVVVGFWLQVHRCFLTQHYLITDL